MNLYYMTVELLGRAYEAEVEYEYEPAEEGSPTSQRYPENILIDRVSLLTLTTDPAARHEAVDVLRLLNRHQLAEIRAEISAHIASLRLPKPRRTRRSFVIEDWREAA